MRTIVVREHDTSYDVDLTAPEVEILRRLVPSIQVQLATGRSGSYDLRPGSTVGVVQIGNLVVEIRPKLPIQRVLFLVSYVIDRRWWRDEQVSLADDIDLFEAIIPAFVHCVRRAFRRGILQGYRTREEALSVVRGRIRFDDQLRHRYGRLPPIEVRYDEFTVDIEANRLIKAATARLRRLPLRSKTSRRLLAEIDTALSLVSEVSYHPLRVPDFSYNRLNEYYRRPVELARLILKSASFELSHGDVGSSACLIDMNKVFEDFVVVALRESLGLTERSFPQGARGRELRLDRRRQISLLPDISWWEGERVVLVGDVKYKRTTIKGVHNSDIYQVLAYAVATGLESATLIYAAGEYDQVSHYLDSLGITIDVLTLHLAGPPVSVLAGIEQIAVRMRASRPHSVESAPRQRIQAWS